MVGRQRSRAAKSGRRHWVEETSGAGGDGGTARHGRARRWGRVRMASGSQHLVGRVGRTGPESQTCRGGETDQGGIWHHPGSLLLKVRPQPPLGIKQRGGWLGPPHSKAVAAVVGPVAGTVVWLSAGKRAPRDGTRPTGRPAVLAAVPRGRVGSGLGSERARSLATEVLGSG